MNTKETAPPGSLQPMGMRPADATLDALRMCLKWIDWCKDAGWREEQLPELEALWWKYYDREGKKRPHTAALCDGEKGNDGKH